jgi:hypothetical protein
MKITAYALAPVCAILLSFGELSQVRAAAPYSLSLALPNEIVESGSAIEAHIALTNISDQPIEFAATDPLCDYSIEIKSLDGRPVTKTKNANDASAGCLDHRVASRSILVRLKPGEQWEEDIHLNEIFDLTNPGGYTVQVSRKIPKVSDQPVESNSVLLTIKPRQ